MNSSPPNTVWRTIANDYGMVFVLALLIAVLSLLTLEEQKPTGSEAGVQVARAIIAEYGATTHVVVVAEATPIGSIFSDAVRKTIEAGGGTVVLAVNGRPIDARRAIESAIDADRKIDVVAASGDTAAWTIYDRFEQIGSDRVVSPKPYLWPTFARIDNLLSVANQTAIYAIIAIGMTMVIITAGIDLSVGSLVALASVTSALLIRDFLGGKDASSAALLMGCLFGVVVCALAGLGNGFAVTWFRVPPFITTLATMMVARGVARRFSAEQSIQALPPSFTWLGGDSTMGIPNPVLLMIALYLLAHLVMAKTVFGRYVYAVGGNAEAARLSGVPAKTVTLLVYTLCGALAGLGGIVLSSKLGTGDPKLGSMYELDVIAAVVVGGTSLMGGEGRVFGTLIGAFIIAVIKNGMNLMNVGAADQQIVLGVVVLLAVLIDTMKRHKQSAH